MASESTASVSRIVRASKFRHVFGTPRRRTDCYDGLRVSRNAWDRDYCAVNPKYLAVVLEAAGGGAFVVLPADGKGRVPPDVPKFTGHRGTVMDIAWDPFDDNVIASCSDDCTIKIWRVPEPMHSDVTEPIMELIGHDRKVGQVLYHPVAKDILLSSAFDFTCRIWNAGTGEELRCIEGHVDTIYTMSWNGDGSLFATTSKDKLVRVIDPRSGEIISQGHAHDGSKASHITFLGDSGRVLTTGFSRMSERQYAIWNINDFSRPLKMEVIDTASGVLFTFYDDDCKIVYLAGKGDGNIRYYEIDLEPPYAHYLNEYKSAAPQRGLGFMPKRGLDVTTCEVARFYKLHSSGLVEMIPMTVPRKSDMFQADIFPDCASGEPALTADQWVAGKNAKPRLMSLKDKFFQEAAESGTKRANSTRRTTVTAVVSMHDTSDVADEVPEHGAAQEEDGCSPVSPVPPADNGRADDDEMPRHNAVAEARRQFTSTAATGGGGYRSGGSPSPHVAPAPAAPSPEVLNRVEALEQEVDSLKKALEELREEMKTLKGTSL